MPRRRRQVIPGCPHHITHRGNHGSDILTTDDERRVYMSLATEWAERTGVVVAAFVLMSNHVHFAAVPPDEHAFSKWIRCAHRDYSRWFNAARCRTGQNWDGRFYSVVMDDLHCYRALRYIEQNPVRAGMVERAWDWPWSSAAWHAGLGSKPKILTADLRPPQTDPAEWRRHLLEPTSDGFRKQLHDCMRHKLPLADAAWIDRMEKQTGLSLRPKPPGRKPQSTIQLV